MRLELNYRPEDWLIPSRSTTLGCMAMAERYQGSNAPAYQISKAALNMLTVQYALQYANEGFIIFAVTPGVGISN